MCWWWWWRENNRNVAVVVYSFTIYEAVLKRKKVRRYEVDVFVDGKIYRINEDVEVEEGNKNIEEGK